MYCVKFLHRLREKFGFFKPTTDDADFTDQGSGRLGDPSSAASRKILLGVKTEGNGENKDSNFGLNTAPSFTSVSLH